MIETQNIEDVAIRAMRNAVIAKQHQEAEEEEKRGRLIKLAEQKKKGGFGVIEPDVATHTDDNNKVSSLDGAVAAVGGSGAEMADGAESSQDLGNGSNVNNANEIKITLVKISMETLPMALITTMKLIKQTRKT